MIIKIKSITKEIQQSNVKVWDPFIIKTKSGFQLHLCTNTAVLLKKIFIGKFPETGNTTKSPGKRAAAFQSVAGARTVRLSEYLKIEFISINNRTLHIT